MVNLLTTINLFCLLPFCAGMCLMGLDIIKTYLSPKEDKEKL